MITVLGIVEVWGVVSVGVYFTLKNIWSDTNTINLKNNKEGKRNAYSSTLS